MGGCGSLDSDNCWMCTKPKLVYGYLSRDKQNMALALEPDIYILYDGRRIPITKKFNELYPGGNSASLAVCRTCDDTSQWPKLQKKRRS